MTFDDIKVDLDKALSCLKSTQDRETVEDVQYEARCAIDYVESAYTLLQETREKLQEEIREEK